MSSTTHQQPGGHTFTAGKIRQLSAKNASHTAVDASLSLADIDAELAGMSIDQLKAELAKESAALTKDLEELDASFDTPGTTTPEAKETQE